MRESALKCDVSSTVSTFSRPRGRIRLSLFLDESESLETDQDDKQAREDFDAERASSKNKGR